MRVTTRFLPLVPALVAVAALSGAALPAGPAAASPKHATENATGHPAAPGRLTREARADGLTAAGGGRMGWRDEGATSTSGALRSSATGVTSAATQTMVPGIDVSSYQGDVDWASYYDQGKRFAYVKATEGSSYTNPSFSQQYGGSVDAGILHGAYHFANPGGDPGGVQASYFIAHGGGWTDNGKTLPGALDIEYNPYSGGTCYGLSASAMRTWISNFLTRYKNVTGRAAVIYTTTDWWTRCTGNTSAFSKTNVLWIARYASRVGTLPAGWGSYGFWQYSDDPVDQDRFFAGLPRLHTFAAG